MKQKSAHILFGGSSGERLVSVASAQNIAATLPDALPWFITASDQIFQCSREKLLAHQDAFTVEFKMTGAPRFQSSQEMIESGEAPCTKDSVLVLALHGHGVEDGALQVRLEKAGIAFTGSGSKASRLAFDKLESKKIALAQGVRTARYFELDPGIGAQALAQELKSMVSKLERVAAKPVADGSSVGLYILDGRSDFNQIAAKLVQNGRKYLVEEFVAGTELTVGVLGDDQDARALPPSEVRLSSGANFDYNAKYLGKGVEELTPARVPDSVTRQAQDLAVKMHRFLGCEGYSRTDMIITRDGPVYLETNTLPGLTKASFLPQQLAVAGISLKEFFEKEMLRAYGRARSVDT